MLGSLQCRHEYLIQQFNLPPNYRKDQYCDHVKVFKAKQHLKQIFPKTELDTSCGRYVTGEWHMSPLVVSVGGHTHCLPSTQWTVGQTVELKVGLEAEHPPVSWILMVT